MTARRPGVVAGVIFGGEGVDVAAETLDIRGNLPRRSIFGPFEEEVFDEEMRDAAFGLRLMPAADTHPEARRDAAHVRHLNGSDSSAIGKSSQAIGLFHQKKVVRINRSRSPKATQGFA